MIFLLLRNDMLVVRPDQADFKPRHESQLAVWGFERDLAGTEFVSRASEYATLAEKLVTYFRSLRAPFTVDASLQPILDRREQSTKDLKTTLARCRALKAGQLDASAVASFDAFLRKSVARQLKPHQVKAAMHLLLAGNGANFSVPGSGKTMACWLRLSGCANWGKSTRFSL